PDLFVLDEPTAGVDLTSQQAFADTLASLVRGGATIVLVAHELGPMAPLVDRAVVMRDGRIAYDGPPPASGGPDADHSHHHPGLLVDGPDHAPFVASPIDRPRGEER
ncbi:MAG: ABC transporter, partial [Nocardioidaceae bacterium]